MQKYDAIENGIANNDVKAIREAIGSIIYTNRDFSNGEFFQTVDYVESKGINLKDSTLIGNPTISSQKSEYNDEDFAKAIFELKKNFCDERIQDVKIIGEKLYGKKMQSVILQVDNNTKHANTQERARAGTLPNQQSRQQNKPIVIVGLVALVIIAIIVAFLLVSK